MTKKSRACGGPQIEGVSVTWIDRKSERVLRCKQLFGETTGDSAIVIEVRDRKVRRECTIPRNMEDIYVGTLKDILIYPFGLQD